MDLKNNLQLKSALDDYLYGLTADLSPENILAATMVCSPRFYRRMSRLIRKAKKLEAKHSVDIQPGTDRNEEAKNHQPVNRWRKKFVLAAVIIAVVLSAFSAVAAHDKITEFFITIYEKYTSIVFDMSGESAGAPDETLTEAPDGSQAYNMPTYIPEGYMQTELEIYGEHALVIYTNSSQDDLIFEVNDPKNLQITVDSERTKGESIMIGQLNGFYYDNKGTQNLIWQDSECVYMITGQIGKEEMIAMAESMY